MDAPKHSIVPKNESTPLIKKLQELLNFREDLKKKVIAIDKMIDRVREALANQMEANSVETTAFQGEGTSWREGQEGWGGGRRRKTKRPKRNKRKTKSRR